MQNQSDTFSATPINGYSTLSSFSIVQRFFRLLYRFLPVKRGKGRLITALSSLVRSSWPVDGVISLDDFGLICADFQQPSYRNLFLAGQYDPQVFWYLQVLLQPGDVFFDVGANYGLFTIISSRLVGQNGSIHSFEPLPDAYNYLERNISVNNLGNVVSNRVAVGQSSGHAMIHRFSDLPIGHTSLSSLGRQDSSPLACDVIALDDYLTEAKIADVNMIKIDVEGSERDVLYGASTLIKRNSPAIILEINRETANAFNYKPEDNITFLSELGYYFFLYSPKNKVLESISVDSNIPDGADIVCVRLESHIDSLSRQLKTV